MATEKDLIDAIRQIVEANQDFRSSMPDDWEGDLLQDAIDAAAKLLPQVKDPR